MSATLAAGNTLPRVKLANTKRESNPFKQVILKGLKLSAIGGVLFNTVYSAHIARKVYENNLTTDFIDMRQAYTPLQHEAFNFSAIEIFQRNQSLSE